MNTPIHDPQEFIKLFCKSAGMSPFDTAGRACAITRSPANYGNHGSVMIEFEGSPPRCCIYYGCGLIAHSKPIKGPRAVEACRILDRFLASHPANANETPVWIGTRWRDRP